MQEKPDTDRQAGRQTDTDRETRRFKTRINTSRNREKKKKREMELFPKTGPMHHVIIIYQTDLLSSSRCIALRCVALSTQNEIENKRKKKRKQEKEEQSMRSPPYAQQHARRQPPQTADWTRADGTDAMGGSPKSAIPCARRWRPRSGVSTPETAVVRRPM